MFFGSDLHFQQSPTYSDFANGSVIIHPTGSATPVYRYNEQIVISDRDSFDDALSMLQLRRIHMVAS